MSEQVPASTVAVSQTVLIDECVAVASAALAAYEYLMTFKHEWNFIRARRWSAVTWLFLVNRYLMVAMATLAMVPVNAQMCHNSSLNLFMYTVQMLPLVVSASFSALRVCALTGRNFALSAVVLLLGLVPVVVSIFVNKGITKIFLDDPALGPTCSGTSGVTSHVFTILSCVTSSALVLADVIVLVVTWIKTYRSVRLARAIKLRNFSEVLLQDGTIYFVASLTLNVLKWVLFLKPVAVLSEEVPTLVSNIIQPLLVSRFIINLRQVDTSSTGDGELDNRAGNAWSNISLRIPTIQSIIGNMGAPLDDGLRDLLDEGAGDEGAVSEHIDTENTGHAACFENRTDEESGGFPSSSRDAVWPIGETRQLL